LSPARIVYVAGTRAFSAGGFAFVVDEEAVRDVVVEGAELAEVVEVVELVELGFELPAEPAAAPLAPDPAVFVVVTDAERVVAAAPVVDADDCLEPPHDAMSRLVTIAAKRRARRLTFAA
jgi:hypothetical protein